MDEYNLAEAFLDPTEVQRHVVDIGDFQKIPFAELAGLGGLIAELIPQFRTVTETINIPMEGQFHRGLVGPDDGAVALDLHDVRAGQVSLIHARGRNPDIAVFISNGKVAAGGRGHAVFVDARHDHDQLVCRVQKFKVHRVNLLCSICTPAYTWIITRVC